MKVWPMAMVIGVVGLGVGLAPFALRHAGSNAPIVSGVTAPASLSGETRERSRSATRLDDDGRDEDGDDDGREGRITRTASAPMPAAPMPVPTAVSTYTKECGACHVAFPPQLLPARSWDALLGNLADHFGDNAELPDATRAELVTWLDANAGDARGSRVTARIPANETPLRITGLPWFVAQHREVPSGWVGGNPDIKSWASCGSCHTRAAAGRYGENEIRIPGHPGWE